jgi:murein DD-endopeptidase MepM/ murein hydrolase activator NlpD
MSRSALRGSPSPAPRPIPRLVWVASLFALACGTIDRAADLFDSRTARERYEARLSQAGLDRSALVRDWTAAAKRALADAPRVTSPHDEEGFFPPAEPAAVAFRVAVRRGQSVRFDLRFLGDASALVFVDAWQSASDKTLHRIASADSGVRSLVLEPERDGDVLIRAQPELLRGGRFRVSIRVSATLAFPVLGRRERDIGSSFGDPRDGGARDHHGIDIFAPRGTPALAAARGTVLRVETTRLGGNVVWLRDARGNAIYYAHLSRQSVVAGQSVRVGDTVGLVGNTGNAIRSRPHLHFGVYRRGEGPLNPFWFVYAARGERVRLTADTSLLGAWVRTAGVTTSLRRTPDERADTVATVARYTPARILGATGAWYYARLPDGQSGYFASAAIEPTVRAVRTTQLARAEALSTRPTDAPEPDQVLEELSPGDQIAVLGQFGSLMLVRSRAGASGWVAP